MALSSASLMFLCCNADAEPKQNEAKASKPNNLNNGHVHNQAGWAKDDKAVGIHDARAGLTLEQRILPSRTFD